MQPAEALKLLDRVAADILAAVNEVTDRRARSDRPGQYQLDLVADGGAVATLTAAGLGVLSEESGRHHPERSLQVVLDPVDGSTNASRGLPWWATSAGNCDPARGVLQTRHTGKLRYPARITLPVSANNPLSRAG